MFFETWNPTKRLVAAALLAVVSTILQSAGGWLPGIGLLISPFSTISILLAVMISIRYGVFSYLLTIFLLVIIEPNELFIFPFTTGVLGLGIGWGISKNIRPKIIILINSLLLFIGICIPLYGIGYPILGPMSPGTIRPRILFLISIFSLLYSWLWFKIGGYFLKRMKRLLSINQ